MHARQATPRNLRARAALTAAAVAIAAMAALIGSTGAAATHQTNSAGAAPSVPWGFNEDWGWGRADFRASVAGRQLSFAGQVMPDAASANRFHVQWAAVEESRGRYRWGKTDRVYHAMRLYSAQPVMVLYNAPVWARDPHAACHNDAACAYPPRVKHLDEWRRFVRRAVERYPEVRAIEVWNEPNLGRFWSPAPDPRRYGAILKGVYEAARAERSSKPVLVGGLAPAGNTATTVGAAEFLKQLYASACACYFQGIATHPYTTQVPLVDNVAKRLDKIRAVRDAAADSAKRLWITEFGLSSNGTSDVTLENQGSELAQVYRSIEGHDVAAFVIHRFHDVGFDGPYWNETGIVREDLSLKPAYCQLGELIGTAC